MINNKSYNITFKNTGYYFHLILVRKCVLNVLHYQQAEERAVHLIKVRTNLTVIKIAPPAFALSGNWD